MGAAAIEDAGRLSGDRCAGCGSALAADQRYCLECGKRVGALGVPGSKAAAAEANSAAAAGTAGAVALPYGLPTLRVPKPRSAGAMAALTLAFGVFVGLSLSPAFPGFGLATGRFVLQLPQAAEQTTTDAGSAGAPSATLASPVGNVGGAPAPAPAAPQATGQVSVSTEAPAPPAEEPPSKPHTKQGGGNGHGPPLPPTHEKPTVQGVVVHVNPVAESYSIATTDEDHQLLAIHDDDLPDPQTKVKVKLRELFNGTFAEAGERTESQTETEATFNGMVTYRNLQDGIYTVSNTGTSILVHLPDSAEAEDMPPLNNEIALTATVKPSPAAKAKRSRHAKAADGCSDEPIAGPDPSSTLEQRSFTIVGPAYGSVDVEGIVERACDASQELGLSADDIRESETDISLASPQEIDLSLLELGQPVDATARIAEDGSYELTGVSSDDGVAGADDSEAGQGDQEAE